MSFDGRGRLILRGVGKSYTHYRRPIDWLWERLLKRDVGEAHWALRDVNIDLSPGEVLGIVGRNGAGKSTLLQLIAGIFQPSVGTIEKSGQVAALLELGAGFNPEFTGLENARLNAALLGIEPQLFDRLIPGIIEFSGIGGAIERPVKTYSSGMYVRLAFAVATAVAPDILIIDEALSVGDEQFAKKSFDRIKTLRDQGVTILFTSHSLYQIEAFCNRAIWLERGELRAVGATYDVTSRYREFLESLSVDSDLPSVHLDASHSCDDNLGHPRIRRYQARVDGEVYGSNAELGLVSRQSTIDIEIEYQVPEGHPSPHFAFAIKTLSDNVITSSSTHNSLLPPLAIDQSVGVIVARLPAIPLLKGRYRIDLYVLDSEGVIFHEHVPCAFMLEVHQHDLEQGYFSIPHQWFHAEPIHGSFF